MAIHYYDDLIIEKIKRWVPEESNLRVLHPDETKRLLELILDDKKDRAVTLPVIALSRKDEIELLSTTKSSKTFDGIRVISDGTPTDFSKLSGIQYQKALERIPEYTHLINVIPIKPEYQLDIYAKTAMECEEYVRNFLFKLINNPKMYIDIPYNDLKLRHVTNIRVLSQIANTSGIGERLFSGQFTRWTIQLELHDAFLFSIPYKRNWTLARDPELELVTNINKDTSKDSEIINY